MASFLYFVADRQAGLSADEIRAIGLGYALDGSVHQQTVSGGPGGKDGVILADGDFCSPGRVRYAPAEQEWIETPFGYLGRWNGDILGPADLARAKPIGGHVVELSDGRKWLCPVARRFALQGDAVVWNSALPRAVAIGPDRKWTTGVVVEKHRRLWEIAAAWWDVRFASIAPDAKAGDIIRFDFDGLYTCASECLAVNYRLGPDEISMLGLFDTDSARRLLDALVDVPSLAILEEELQKKTSSRVPGG